MAASSSSTSQPAGNVSDPSVAKGVLEPSLAGASPDEYTDFETAVHRVLLNLKAGDVITYGEVAAEAGYPGAARAVGSFLRKSSGYPWWRVIAASGRLVPHNEVVQRERLVSEGVTVENGKVLLR